MSTEENKSLEVFGTTEISVKEFMGSTEKSLVLLSDYEKAKQNLLDLRIKHEERVVELHTTAILSATELKELNAIRAELREPRYLIQNIEKNNISVFEAYKKTDKANLKELIEINKNLEDIASDKIKLEDDRKKLEKEAEAKAEENRIAKIKSDIENIESYCLEVIQKMTFDNMKVSSESIEQSLNEKYDFEEYDLLFDQVKGRVTKLLLDKVNDIVERENQRLENERMKQEIFEVRVNRLKEFGYSLVDDKFISDEFGITFLKSNVLNHDSNLFEMELNDLRNLRLQAEQAKRDAEIEKQKDEQFMVRKNRLEEIGVINTFSQGFSFIEYKIENIPSETIYNASITEFEAILTVAKKAITDAKEQKEKKYREDRFIQRKELLLNIGFEISRLGFILEGSKFKIELEDVQFADESKYELILIEANKEVSSILKAKAKKADAENKARVKRLAEDKEWLRQNIELSVIEIQDVSIKNKESLDFIEVANANIKALKSELLTKLNEL